jgi:hypothetical protein
VGPRSGRDTVQKRQIFCSPVPQMYSFQPTHCTEYVTPTQAFNTNKNPKAYTHYKFF